MLTFHKSIIQFVIFMILGFSLYAQNSDLDKSAGSIANARGEETVSENKVTYAMVIHGGAGTILKKNMTAEKEKAYIAALTHALTAGYQKIKEGKSSLDAVEAAIHVLEDNPLFNAGKGAVFTHDGRNEMDAAIMNGKTLAAGAVAGVTNIRNPISAARAVMEKSEHVLMAGPGAEKFAKEAGLEIVNLKYFFKKCFMIVRVMTA